MKIKAKLYGLYSFNPFDANEVKKAKYINAVVSFLSFLLFLYLLVLLSRWTLSIVFENGFINLFMNMIFGLGSLSISLMLSFGVRKSFSHSLNKINADKYLNEFNVSKNEKLKENIKEDIDKNTYFSANGYWIAKNQVKDFKKRLKEREAVKEKAKLENARKLEKYPNIYLADGTPTE